MKIKMINKKVIAITSVFFILIVASTNNTSHAEAKGFEGFNNAPRKYMSAEKDKFSDVQLRLKDNNGIKSVNLYEVDNKGNKTKIDFSTADTQNDKNQLYTMSHEKMLKGKTKKFYIKVTDKTGNVLATDFRVCAKTNPDHYAIDDGPRIINWKQNGNDVALGVRDNEGTNYIKIQDGNNSNKEICRFNNLSKGEARISIDMTKFKKVDGIYNLRIVAEDAGKTNEQSIRTLAFKMKTITMNSTNTNTNTNSTVQAKNKTYKILFVGNSKTYINDIPAKFKGLAKAAGYKVDITEATEGGRTLKYLASNKKSTITKKAYDYVVLQEQTDTYAKKYSTFLSGAKAVKKLVKNKNSKVQLIVRQTWVKKSSSSSTKEKAYNHAQKVAKEIGADLVYDGKAFDKSRSTYSSINLYKDDTHQSSAGAYLSACCIFKTVFNQSPVGLSYKSSLSADRAKKLQKISDNF